MQQNSFRIFLKIEWRTLLQFTVPVRYNRPTIVLKVTLEWKTRRKRKCRCRIVRLKLELLLDSRSKGEKLVTTLWQAYISSSSAESLVYCFVMWHSNFLCFGLFYFIGAFYVQTSSISYELDNECVTGCYRVKCSGGKICL